MILKYSKEDLSETKENFLVKTVMEHLTKLFLPLKVPLAAMVCISVMWMK